MRVKTFAIPKSRKIETASGTVYYANDAGTRIRVSPSRPWRGKSQRRAVIRARREDREFAQQNQP